MSLKQPTHEEMADVADQLGMHLSPAQLDEYLGLMVPTVAAYNLLERMPDELPRVKYPRTPGYAPSAEENPHNGWYYKSEIRGAKSGKLKGKTLAIKDNICVAGVPMMNGSSTLQGYVPEIDATIVERILDAGGVILGKAHCELFCFSGGSHTNSTGTVANPLKAGYMAGGSSSGSAALVAAGDVDMAIGGDQAGSIRIPAAYCGTVGMKPTFGLVPYTGIMPIEATIDHTGPITANVADSALLLEVLAGPDGLDPRQNGVKVDNYTNALGGSVKGMRIGIVKEGFLLPNAESDVNDLVRKGAALFKKMGAQVEEVSVPVHAGPAQAVWSAIAHEGALIQMMHGNGFGFNWKGLYLPSLMRAHDGWRDRVDELSDSLKVTMLMGQYMLNKHRGQYYAKAQNLARRITAGYDAALAEYDLLLMPTVPHKASKVPPPNASITEICTPALDMIGNTMPFDVTGHPAISIPCGFSDGLPVGLMLVGKHWNESTIYRAAHAFEQASAKRGKK
ncbi:MAG: amidase [Alphaproteobacteria bacterium]|nr:amidase [Alphaproteobacteria bacterium]